jgi:hypothetical protein
MTYNIDDILIRVINNLTEAVNVCCEVDESSDDHEKTYPFATGYSRAAMNGAIDDLRLIVKQLRKPMEEFYDYVLAFYGENGIYKIGATRDMVMEATQKYISSGADFTGDSFDREHVRDIMLNDYGLTMV